MICIQVSSPFSSACLRGRFRTISWNLGDRFVTVYVLQIMANRKIRQSTHVEI